MKLGIIGAKSYPNKYGGFETLVETLLFSKKFYRSWTAIILPIENSNKNTKECERLRKENIYIVSLGIEKSKKPFRFYLESIYACSECDVLLILGLGAGFYLPFVRMIFPKTKVVVNVDGLEWLRKKFNLSKRILLYILALFNIRFASRIVFDSKELIKRFPLSNTKSLIKKSFVIGYTSRYELYSYDSYCDVELYDFICVTRFVPENNIEMICDAWSRFVCDNKKTKLKIALIGDFMSYGYDLKKKYPEVAFLGPIYNIKKLYSYLSLSKYYIHGHSVGGTNPALIEAMSLNKTVFCHRNPFNLWATNGIGYFFDNSSQLTDLFSRVSSGEDLCVSPFQRYKEEFSFQVICDKYINVLR